MRSPWRSFPPPPTRNAGGPRRDDRVQTEWVCAEYNRPGLEAHLSGCYAVVRPVVRTINSTGSSLYDLSRVCPNVFASDWRGCLSRFNRGIYDRPRPVRKPYR